MESPYTPGSGMRPRVFAGREAIMCRAEVTLTRVANQRDDVPPMVLTGPRGLGKTVTLAEIATVAAGRGFVVCPVAFDSVSDNLLLLAAALAQAVTPHLRRASPVGRSFLRRLESLSVEINAGLVKITSPGGVAADASEASQRQVLADLLTKSGRLAAGDHKPGVVVLIDEIQEAPRSQLVVLCNALQDSHGSSVVVFAAGLPGAPDQLMAAASFSERFDYQELTRLDRASAERALVEPSLALGVRWRGEAVESMLREAAGSPFLIQKLGNEAWLIDNPAPGSSISAVVAGEAIVRTRRDLGVGMFRGRWAKASPRQQEFMVAAALCADELGIARTADLTRLLRASTPQLSRVRKALMDKGLVESPGTGLLRFTMPGFASYVLSQADSSRLGPLPPALRLALDSARGSVTTTDPDHVRASSPRGEGT